MDNGSLSTPGEIFHDLETGRPFHLYYAPIRRDARPIFRINFSNTLARVRSVEYEHIPRKKTKSEASRRRRQGRRKESEKIKIERGAQEDVGGKQQHGHAASPPPPLVRESERARGSRRREVYNRI